MTSLQTDFGDLEILSCISIGGQATVYKVRKVSEEEIYALKVLHTTTSRESIECEVALVSSLNHKHIITQRKVLTPAEEIAVLMPYCQTLLHLDRRIWTFRRALNIFMQVCSALNYIHERGIVHRDIKPDNILFSEGLFVSAMLSDFGLAVSVEEKCISPAGTIEYMSYEAMQGLVSLNTDIYALAVTLYWLLTSRLPFWVDSSGKSKTSVELEYLNLHRACIVPPTGLPTNVELALTAAFRGEYKNAAAFGVAVRNAFKVAEKDGFQLDQSLENVSFGDGQIDALSTQQPLLQIY